MLQMTDWLGFVRNSDDRGSPAAGQPLADELSPDEEPASIHLRASAAAEKAAELLGPDFDLEVVEMHHRLKKDSPSGTARRLAEVLAKVRDLQYESDVRHGREGIVVQGACRPIPWDKVLPVSAPDGGVHVCATRSARVLCVVLGAGA